MQETRELPLYENLHTMADEQTDEKFFPEPGIPVEHKERKMADKFFLYLFIFFGIVAPLSMVLCISFVRPTWENEVNDPYYERNRHRIRPNSLLILFRLTNGIPEFSQMFVGYMIRISIGTVLCVGLTSFLAVLFKCATTVTLWCTLILAWVSGIVIIGILLSSSGINFIFFIVLMILKLALLVAQIFAWKKINLVVILFREAATTLFSIKKMAFLQILALILQIVIMTGFLASISLIVTFLENKYYNLIIYFCYLIVCIAAFWAMAFVTGIQYMTVSGAVTKWYFSRNKSNVRDDILYAGFCTTLRYHLGTIALASLVLTLLSVPRAIFIIFKWMVLSLRLRILFSWLINPFTAFFKFFSKHSYTVTAMYGTSFIQSGRKSKELLSLNVCNVNFATSTGDFFILFSQIFMATLPTVLTLFLFMDMFYIYSSLCYTFVFGTAFVCSYAILSMYEAAFSTLFLCINQDFLMNDGVEKPYAMNENLRQFLKRSQTIFEKKIRDENLPQIYSV